MIRRCLLVLAGFLLLAGCASACSSSSNTPTAGASGSDLNGNTGNGPFLGAAVDPAEPRPSFTLTDTSGKPYSFAARTANEPTLLYFGYTHCPDICPETMADVKVALHAVPAAVAARTHVVFVSTDVKVDTGPVIAQWLGNFSTGTKGTWTGLRGTQAEIDAAQAAAHITVAEDGGKTHSARLLLYGPDNYAHVTFLESSDTRQQIEHDLPLVAKGRT